MLLTNGEKGVIIKKKNICSYFRKEILSVMSNWLCKFEKYRSDKMLLDTRKSQLKVLLDDYGYARSDSRVTPVLDAIAELEISLGDTEKELDCYVANASTPREAAKRADEKLFLTYRYVHNMTMEETAEEMCVSRDTVYRIRRRIAN